jgi:hypothetical protein
MTSTALASSGGMTNSAILRMTEVARKASLALGRDMPDSMDRLTKGIVKIQPELLDELGIMARVIPAQQAYAKAVGKSVTDLTEFEKRQAFANAVLDEGERKFSAIALQTNPYSKILASTQNLMQTTLELVNTALSPLLNLLSSSPMALGLALAFIGKTLLSMALPAMGQWKKGLDSANEAARQNVIETNAQRVAHRKNIDTILAAKTANDELAAATKANLAIEALSNKSSVKTKRLLPETANAVDKEGLNLLEKQNLALKKQGDLLEKKLTTLTSPGAIARNTEELNGIRAATKAIEEKIVAGRAYEALESESYSKIQYFTKAATDARKADAAAAKSQRTAITKATSEAYQKGGMSEGWKALTDGVDKAKKGLDTTGVAFDNNQKAMSGWNGLLTKAAGIGIIAVGVFETLAAALSSIFIYIGVAVAAFELLDFAFGKNSKQAEAAATALDNLSSASQAANNVLKDLEARDPLYKISTAAMTAKANAILEVGDASTKAFKAIKEQFDSASWFDTLVDKGKILLGTNLLKKSSTELAKSVSETFRLASPGPEAAKALKEIKDLTGINPTDQEALKKYLNDTPEKFLEIAPKITAAMQQLGTDLSVTASKGKEFDDAFKTAGATFDAILVSMMPSDNLSKLGFETIDIAQKMGKALEDPTTALSKLVEISGDTSKLRFFSPDAAAELYKASPQIKIMTSDISAYTAGLERLKQEEQDLRDKRSKTDVGFIKQGIDKKLTENKTQQDLLVGVLDPLKAKIQPYVDKLNKEQAAIFENGAKKVADGISIGFEKARLTVAKATAQGLGDTAQGIQVRASLDKKDIDIQIRQLNAQTALSTVMDSLRIVEEERLVFDQQKELNDKQKERNDKGISATPSEREKESKLSGQLVNRRVGIEIAKEMQTATLDAVMSALKLPVGSARQIAANIALPGAQQRAGAASQKAQFDAQKTATDITTGYTLMDHEIKVQKDLKATELERLTTQQQELDIRVKNALYLNQSLLTQKQLLAEQIALNKEASDNLDIENEIAKAKRASGKPGETAASSGGLANTTAVTELQNKLAQKQQRDREAAAKRAAGYTEEAGAATQASRAFSTQQEVDANTALVKAEETRIAIAKERFNVLNSMGALDAKAVIDANAQFAIEELNRAASQSLFDKRIAFEKEDAALKAQQAVQAPGSKEALDLQTQIDLKKTYYDQSVAGENALLAAKTSSTTQQQAYNTLLDAQKTTMEKMVDTTANLSTLFGELGTNIGKAGEALLAMAQQDTQYLEQKKALTDQLNDSEPKSAKEKEATKALMSLEDKHTKDRLKNEITVYNASKKIFKEETVAYKVLDGLEKVSTATKLYNDNKELISTVVNLGKKAAIELGFLSASVTAEEAADMAKATSKVPAVIMEFLAQLGPWGAAAAGVAIAAVLGGGGSGGSNISVPKPEYATGTATTEGGVITGTGKGGDVTAQNTALEDSLGILSSFARPEFNLLSKMQRSMASVDDAMTSFLIAVAPTMGVTSGAAAAAVGPVSSGSGMSDITKLGGAVLLGGIAAPLLMGQVQSLSNAITGLLGGDGMTLSGGTSVSAAGLDIQQQTLSDAAKQTSVKNFTDTWTEIQHDGPYGWKSWHESHPGPSFSEAADKATTDILTNINANILDTYIQVADSLKVDPTIVGKQVATIGKIDKLGKTAEEYAKLVGAEYGKFTDQIARALIPNISDFQQKTESVGTTIVRLAAGMDEASYYTDKLGISTINYNEIIRKRGDISAEALRQSITNVEGTSKGIGEIVNNLSGGAGDIYAVYSSLLDVRGNFELLGISSDTVNEKLIRSAGGLEALSQGLSDFESKFLTKEEQKAASQLKLYKAFAKIGVEVPKTAEQFKALVLSLKDGGDASSELLGKLLPLSSLVETVVGPLVDLAGITDKLKAAYTSSNNALTNSIKLLTDYKTALISGSNSLLSPAEKYAQAKALLLQTTAAAKAAITSTSTDAERAARDAAVAKIPSLIDGFMSTSKDINASSAQYSADFATATDILDSTTGILSTQQTDQQKQLGWLETTAESTKTMAELFTQYLTAGGSVASMSVTPHANGGLAKGWSLVGEQGPELVDFVNPGRVYSNQASNDMFNNKELISEIKALREEVCQLRDDQNKQTGALIDTTLKANAQNAEAIATANANMVNQQNWKNRSQVRVA